MTSLQLAVGTGVVAGLVWLSMANRAAMMAPVQSAVSATFTDLANVLTTTEDFLYKVMVPTGAPAAVFSKMDIITPGHSQWAEKIHSRGQLEQDLTNLKQ